MVVIASATPILLRVHLGRGLLFHTSKSSQAPREQGRWLHNLVLSSTTTTTIPTYSCPLRHGGDVRQRGQNREQVRCMAYTSMSKQEEDEEKKRVSALTDAAKEQELRQLNRDIARLEMLKGINTGDRYTLRGQYKQLARDYGLPLALYWWAVYGAMLGVTYMSIEWGLVDVMRVMCTLDGWTGYDISGNVKPEYGKIGLAIALNEVLEPIRLPFVVFTVKPLVDTLFPGKY